MQHGPLGIRANAIAPGAIRTEIMEGAIADAADPAGMEREVALLHPLERIGDTAAAAAAAVFLLGDDSSFVSGQILGVDGGASARAYRFESALRPRTP